MMRKLFLSGMLSLTALFVFQACNDPVFYTISQEVKPVEPRIKGSPTNFVVFDNAMFVASGKSLHWYSNTGNEPGWDNEKNNVPQPGGRITCLAATDNYLYALCYDDSDSPSSAVVKRYNGSDSWEKLKSSTDLNIGDYDSLQSVYAAGEVLFISAEKSNNFDILYFDESDVSANAIKKLAVAYIDESNNVEKEPEYAGELCGAVYDGAYYLCTKGEGIYKTDNPSSGAILIESSSGIDFIGIINLGNTVTAITRKEGKLYDVQNPIIETDVVMGSLATGALAIWRQENSAEAQELLLSGRQYSLEYTTSSGYTYGYMELELDSGRIKTGGNFREPGESPSSIDDNDRYKSTIGKQPVKHIFQAPYEIDDKMTLFASTQKNGVWSYKKRDGTPQWNAEE
jgi:hypothetical protein